MCQLLCQSHKWIRHVPSCKISQTPHCHLEPPNILHFIPHTSICPSLPKKNHAALLSQASSSQSTAPSTVAHAKNLRAYLAFIPLLLTPHIQPISKSYQLYLKNTPKCISISPSTASSAIQATTISHIEYCNHLQSSIHTATRSAF